MREVLGFEYDMRGTAPGLEELEIKTQFTTGVVIQRQRVMKTRAVRFALGRAGSNSIAMKRSSNRIRHLEKWLDIAGDHRSASLDRPEKSGDYGRFKSWKLRRGKAIVPRLARASRGRLSEELWAMFGEGTAW